MFGKKKKLLAAARANDVAGVKKYSMRGDAHFEACMEAVKHDAPQALDAMLEKRGYDFTGYSYKNLHGAREILEAISNKDAPEELYLVLLKANIKKSWPERINNSYIMSKNTPLQGIQEILKDHPNDFEDCLRYIGRGDTEKMEFILTHTSKSANPQDALNKALLLIAEDGDVEKAGLLLERCASPDYEDGFALQCAAENGHTDMVMLLLPLVSLKNYGADIVTNLRQNGALKAIIEVIDAATRDAEENTAQKTSRKTAPVAAPQSAPVSALDENYMCLDNHTLADVQPLPTGGTLTTLFNFTTKQQQLVTADAEGTPRDIRVIDLDEKRLAVLRKKFDALAAQEQSPANENAEKKPELASQDIAKRLNGAGL